MKDRRRFTDGPTTIQFTCVSCSNTATEERTAPPPLNGTANSYGYVRCLNCERIRERALAELRANTEIKSKNLVRENRS